jgi:poly(A) polymerase
LGTREIKYAMKKEYIPCLMLLEECHGRFYVAGGPVRDLLLDRETPDIDIVVPHGLGGLPADFARGVKGRYVLLHDKKDQVTERVIIQGQAPLVFDFTRMQGASIEEDLAKRDFTLNAMALPLGDYIGGRQDRIIDPHGGRKALRDRRISAVSEGSFIEDPLRLLRAFRFAAELRFRIDPETLKWIRIHRRLLERVSGERIRDEIFRILSCQSSYPFVVEMDRLGILEVLFPEISAMKEEGRTKICGVDPWKHALAALRTLETVMEKPGGYFNDHAGELENYLENEVAPDREKAALIKLAALLNIEDSPGETGTETLDNLILRLRLSKKEGVFLGRISRRTRELSVLMGSDQISRKGAALFFSRNKDDYFGLFLLHLGRVVTSKKSGLRDVKKKILDMLLRYEKEIKPALQSPPFIDGEDLMDFFRLKPGPVIGKILTAVRAAQLEGVIGNRSQALALAGKLLKK